MGTSTANNVVRLAEEVSDVFVQCRHHFQLSIPTCGVHDLFIYKVLLNSTSGGRPKRPNIEDACYKHRLQCREGWQSAFDCNHRGYDTASFYDRVVTVIDEILHLRPLDMFWTRPKFHGRRAHQRVGRSVDIVTRIDVDTIEI